MSESIRSVWRGRNWNSRSTKVCCILGVMIVLHLINLQTTILGFRTTSTSRFATAQRATPCLQPHDATKPVIQYVIMLDAGSTGSRVHVYRFNACQARPELEDEFFKSTEKRPKGAGLSSYENAQAAAESLDPLLEFAQISIPKAFHACTPIAVKATAGLRLLGDALSAEILEAVRTRLETRYPFHVVSRGQGGVDIMSGEDEGVFAWITTNYLLDRLGESNDNRSTTAIVDMGGGSVQVAFQVHTPNTVGLDMDQYTKSTESNYEHHLQFNKQDLYLYQHSHLGFGLMSAREKMYQLLFDRAYSQRAKPTSWSSRILNPCLVPGSRIETTIRMPPDHALAGEHRVEMEGLDRSNSEQCQKLAESILNEGEPCPNFHCSVNDIYQPSVDDAGHEDVYIFSYFYDRTSKLGMPDVFTVAELYELTSKVCSGNGVWRSAFGHVDGALQDLRAMPEWCLDLSYMSTLLHKGFGMSLGRKLHVADRIKGKEIGWCLGASLSLLDAGVGWGV